MKKSSTAVKTTTTQIPCPPSEDNNRNNNNAYDLQHLQQRTQWLVDHHEALGKVCIAIAGGGGHAISTLAATSGASKLLLEGTIIYDRSSFQTFVQKNLPNDKSFSYSSLEAANMASRQALLQGMQIKSRHAHGVPSLSCLKDTVGVGSASTLKTTTQGGMSKSGRPSHGNIVATKANGIQVGMNLTLNCPTQDRFQQDVFVSHMILQSLETLLQQVKGTNQQQQQEQANVDNKDDNEETITKPEEYEGITLRQWSSTLSSADATTDGDHDTDAANCPVQTAAHQILSGQEKAVLLLPKTTTTTTTTEATTEDSSSKQNDDCSFLESLLFPVLPDNCLIFPGSFNPPHHGHLALAQSAIDKVSKNVDGNNKPRPLVFEISIKNADKPSIEPHEVARRVALFQDVIKEHGNLKDWGILLTSAPLFGQKVEDLKEYAPAELKPDPKFPIAAEMENNHRWCFVIGTDTMERILNPKYYDHSFDKMLASIRSMGVDFVVGGRLDQKTNENQKFMTGEDILEDMPKDIQDMFVILSEEDFRVDVSSTELRKSIKQHQQEA